MKLKTTCTQHIISGSTDDFSHDATAAHALLQAMDWYEGNSRHGHGVAGVAVALIRGRAAEILAGWGMGDAESN